MAAQATTQPRLVAYFIAMKKLREWIRAYFEWAMDEDDYSLPWITALRWMPLLAIIFCIGICLMVLVSWIRHL